MTKKDHATPPFELYFTSPWEPIVVRRGDALGLRAFADQLAEAVAPNLSSRIRDARWVTILAWCLVRSHAVFDAEGGGAVRTRQEQQARYSWLRPLELMWVARTIALADGGQGRSLAGQRAVKPWHDDGDRSVPLFGLTEDQYAAYRQTGMYGRYRLAFRKWPGLSVAGNGWTPDRQSIALAKWLDGQLGVAAPEWKMGDIQDHKKHPLAKKPNLGKGDKNDWWLRQKHWGNFNKSGKNADKNTLPRRQNDHSTLPKEEKDLLQPIIFGKDSAGSVRRAIALRISKTSANDHLGLCKSLAVAYPDNPRISILPTFSRLADAGIAGMELITNFMVGKSHAMISEIANSRGAKSIWKEIRDSSRAWDPSKAGSIRHADSVSRFADAMKVTRNPEECLRALLDYHLTHGGGLRWFSLEGDVVTPMTMTMPAAGASRYRFRLWSLCRLAAQTGVINGMPIALQTEDDNELEDSSDE